MGEDELLGVESQVKDAYALDPSKIYGVQVDRPYLTHADADAIKRAFEQHGISVIVLPRDVHLVEPPEVTDA